LALPILVLRRRRRDILLLSLLVTYDDLGLEMLDLVSTH
jgi:hypothetical protein